MTPADFDYIDDLSIDEKERLYKKFVADCPNEIAAWNAGFFGVIKPLISKKEPLTSEYLKIIIEWWEYRKKLEAKTNCHPFWVMRKEKFIKTFAEVRKELGIKIEGAIDESKKLLSSPGDKE